MTWEAQRIEVGKSWSGVEKTVQGNGQRASISEPIGKSSKRFVDVILASTALLLLSPLLLIVALIVKFSDGGPVFYSHSRVGLGGGTFSCLKFRTMKQDAGARLTELLKANPTARMEWEATRKLKNDPRITVVGAILRESSIDELPQLINIVRGEMSLVGPRPITSEELPFYGEHASSYMAGRPGLTGHWQINGRNDVSYEQRVSLDVQYLQNWSLAWDFVIMAKTVPVLFSHRGSY
jgi:exopolysaccharide production protein ExoY